MSKDWTGNSNSIFVSLGASNHSDLIRVEKDYYATEPRAVELLLEKEKFSQNIWEPACGEGHISKVLEGNGHKVYSTDLIDRGYGIGDVDFLSIGSLFGTDKCLVGGALTLSLIHHTSTLWSLQDRLLI